MIAPVLLREVAPGRVIQQIVQRLQFNDLAYDEKAVGAAGFPRHIGVPSAR